MGSLHADRASRGKEVLGADDVARSLTRIAYEIIERNGGSDNLVIAGIPTRGATLARRLVDRIREVSDTYANLAIIDTTLTAVPAVATEDAPADPTAPELPPSGRSNDMEIRFS